jgi:hypothetical protein
MCDSYTKYNNSGILWTFWFECFERRRGKICGETFDVKAGRKKRKERENWNPHIFVFLTGCSFFPAIILFCSNPKGNLAYNVDLHISCSDCTRVVVLATDC